MTVETPSPKLRSASAPGLSSVAALVRQYDRDRFQTALFAPAERREGLFALYAFNFELARVREMVSEPMLGQIRLQWWRDIVAAAFASAPTRAHPIALSLATAIRDLGLSRGYFDRLIDTRERDLDDAPPPSLAELEDYAEGTSATLVALALEILGGTSAAAYQAARSVGIAYGLAGLLRAMPFHAAQGRCYIPVEIADRAGLDPRDYAAMRATPGLCAAAAEIAAAATAHLRNARDRGTSIPRKAIAAVLPAIVAERYLTRLRRAGHDPFDRRLRLPDGLQSWRLAAAALRGRF